MQPWTQHTALSMILMIRMLSREELFEEMMGERDDVAAKRASCQAAVAALRQAMSAVDSVPQTLLSRINSPHRCLPLPARCLTPPGMVSGSSFHPM